MQTAGPTSPLSEFGRCDWCGSEGDLFEARGWDDGRGAWTIQGRVCTSCALAHAVRALEQVRAEARAGKQSFPSAFAQG
ncbi:MAG TPA: hypothetical protein VIC85_18665 [Ktedonobacterales bacterium]|jgi:hypothetical protein